MGDQGLTLRMSFGVKGAEKFAGVGGRYGMFCFVLRWETLGCASMLMGFSEPSVHLLHSSPLCSPVGSGEAPWHLWPSVQKSLQLILLLSASPPLMRQLGEQLGLLGDMVQARTQFKDRFKAGPGTRDQMFPQG